MVLARRIALIPRRRFGTGPGTFTNQGIKNYATLERQDGALNVFKEWTETFRALPRWLRRFNESWWKWVPACYVMFYWTEWAHKFNHHAKRKNPEEFANDE